MTTQPGDKLLLPATHRYPPRVLTWSPEDWVKPANFQGSWRGWQYDTPLARTWMQGTPKRFTWL